MRDWTCRQMYGKQTIMKTPDMSRVKWSKAQKANRERFREAMAEPGVRAHDEKVANKAGSWQKGGKPS
jgi:hypothetical protein